MTTDRLRAPQDGASRPGLVLPQEAEMLTRDDLAREARARGGNLPAFVVVYLAIVATMAATAMAIL